MPQRTVELSQNQQKGLVQHLFSSREFTLSDNATIIADIDPDLSVTSGLIAQRIETTSGRGCAPDIERFLDVGFACMIQNISQDKDQKIPKKRTDQDLSALQKIDTILNTHPRVPFTDREQDQINERALTIFGFITAQRPDLTARAKFPWNTTLHLALNRPADTLSSKYDYRVNILTKAPKALAQKAMAEYANKGKDILETLYYEKTFMESGMPEESPKLWEVIRLAPDGNLPLAQSTLRWALRVQSHAMFREREPSGEPITIDVLSRTWKLAQNKWNALSTGDKGEFITMDMLNLYEHMYTEQRERGEMPLPQMDQILNSMIQNASDSWKKDFTEAVIVFVKECPKKELGMITEWFPIIAGTAEAHRPKTFFQKAAILFQRS